MSISSRFRHTLVVRRMVASLGSANEVVGGASTTLTTDVAPGALIVSIGSAANLIVDDWIRVGDSAETEIRQVASLDGLDVGLASPLLLAHDSGDPVREVDGAGEVERDDYGQTVRVAATIATIRGLVQPRRAREVALASQAGVVLGEHIGYIAPLVGLTTHDWIEVGAVGGPRYDILSVADAGGVGHHLELGLKAVT